MQRHSDSKPDLVSGVGTKLIQEDTADVREVTSVSSTTREDKADVHEVTSVSKVTPIMIQCTNQMLVAQHLNRYPCQALAS